MSTPLLFRAFVNEKLTAAVDEIFQVFKSTISKYEEEASSSKQEIERLRGLLQEFVSNQKTAEACQSFICKAETPPQQYHSELELCLSIDQRDPESQHIKKEDIEEFKDANALYPTCLPVWENNEQNDLKSTLLPQTQNCEMEEQFQELQKTKTLQFVLPGTSSLSLETHIQSKRVQDGRKSERPPEYYSSNQTQTEQQRRSLMTSRESSELSQFNVIAPNHYCHLCDKSFSSNHHLINHAFRMHSKYPAVLCAVCGKTLESTDSLNVHLKSHKSSKCCHVCGKYYKNTTSLTDHIASHTGAKLHCCHVCGKGCRRKGDLKIHMRIHTGEKPFCCSYCHKNFTHSGHLKKHIRSHTGERPHRCEVCGRGFLQSTHLKYHLGTHR
ncbi:Zinc finger protein 846 [Channa argus]|uniref:Zinc finger protein 846 n=1 Tax=Channa argus TaxID=215402 RepID=A0A6G1R030_CHAAH|nr:Zinc finger protein 846 [Channa argus]